MKAIEAIMESIQPPQPLRREPPVELNPMAAMVRATAMDRATPMDRTAAQLAAVTRQAETANIARFFMATASRSDPIRRPSATTQTATW